LTPNFITRDERTVLLYVQMIDAKVENFGECERPHPTYSRKAFSGLETSVGGAPAVQTDLGLLLNKELRNFLVLSFIGCAILLALIFETLSTMIIPLLLTAFANIVVLGIMALTGITFTILSSTIPIIVFITVVALSAHVLLRVHEDSQAWPSK